MSVISHSTASSQTVHSFGSALQQLARRNGELTDTLEAFLRTHASKLAECTRPFKIANAASRAKVDSGTLTTAAGENIKLGVKEKEVVKQLADTLDIDEVQSAALLRAYRQGKNEDVGRDIETSITRSDDFWAELTSFVLDEQLRVIQVVAFLLRTADLEERVPAEVIHRLAADVATPQFASEILRRVEYLVTTLVPSKAVPFSPIWAKSWVQQQKALLEVYFLLHYNRLFPNGKSLLEVLNYVKSTNWGTAQVNEGLFDQEAQALGQDVAALTQLILVENINLERAASSQAEELSILPGKQTSEDDLLHPPTLQKVHHLVIELVTLHPRQSALLALAWSLVLLRITESMSSVPLPESYFDIAQEILPADLHPRRENRVAAANLQAQALWQQLVTHALSPHASCLSLFLEVISSTLLYSGARHTADAGNPSSADPNLAGYLSVLRSALAAVPRLVQPSYLPQEDFADLVAVFESLYSHPAASLLRGSFWGLFEETDADPIRDEEWQLFELAIKRFPAEVSPFVRMVSALSGGRSSQLLRNPWDDSVSNDSEEARVAEGCVGKVLECLQQPRCLTQTLPPISPVMPLPYEPSKRMQAGPLDINAVRPINISPSLIVPAGTAGRIVSKLDHRPLIVSWDLSHIESTELSSLRFFGDSIAQFVASCNRKTGPATNKQLQGDVFRPTQADSNVPEAFYRPVESLLADVTNMLTVIRNLVSIMPAQTSPIVRSAFGSRTQALRTLFAVLEISALSEDTGDLFVTATNLVAALVGTFPDDVWTYLRSSDTIFPLEKSSGRLPVWGSRRTADSSDDLLSQDRLKGSYQRTIACLELVQSLVLQAQWTVEIDPPDIATAKGAVLGRAVRWILDSIWTSYSSWRYNSLREKFGVGVRLSHILKDVLDEAATGSGRAFGSASSAVLTSFTGSTAYVYTSVLLDVINGGMSSLYTLSSLGRIADCGILEDCLEGHLQVASRILVRSRSNHPSEPSTLERLLLAHNTVTTQPGQRGDAIYMLSELTVSIGTPRLATAAAELLALLCRLSSLWGTPSERPSLLGHLGGIRQSNDLVNRLLDIAGDPYADVTLQLSIWRFLTSAAENQAGLAAILITGHQALAGQTEDTSQAGGSGLSLATEVLRGWREAWDVQPALLYAALAFLAAVWQGYVDSNKAVQDLRKADDLWQSACEILQKDLEPPSHMQTIDASPAYDTDYAHRRSSQSLAANWLTLDVQHVYATHSSSDPTINSIPSVRWSSVLISNRDKLQACLRNARHLSLDLDLLEETIASLKETFYGFQLEAYPASEDFLPRPFGKTFFYSGLVHKRLVGAARKGQARLHVVEEAQKRIDDLNLLWSQASAEIALLVGMGQWLNIILCESTTLSQSAESISAALKWFDENLHVPITNTLVTEQYYAGTLGIVLTLVKALAQGESRAYPNIAIPLLSMVGKLYANDIFTVAPMPQDRLPDYAVVVSQICYFVHRICSRSPEETVDLRRSNKSRGSKGTSQACLLACLTAQVQLMEWVGRSDGNIREHMKWSSAAICEILSTQSSLSSAQWLAQCRNLDFFRQCGNLIGRLQFTDADLSIAFGTLDILLAMAREPQAAESMALDGIVYALCNNALTVKLESGSFLLPTPRGEASLTSQSQREVWISFISLVCQLVLHLGSRLPFVEQELATFLQMYRAQITQTLSWTSEASLTVLDLKEQHAIYMLLSSCVSSTSEDATAKPMLHKMLLASLRLLQHHIYLIQHPNLLITLVQPLSAPEADWLASDAEAPETIGLGDFDKHPVVATLTQQILSLCWLQVTMFVKYTRSFMVLTKERVDWPKDKVVIAAIANVSLDEPATLGTLFDLARFCTDVSRYCKPGSEAAKISSPLPQYCQSRLVETAEQCFEGTLLLMSTQIALTAQQQDTAGDQDRASQRARRDLKEVASDLVEEFLDKNTGPSQSNERKLSDALKKFVLQL